MTKTVYIGMAYRIEKKRGVYTRKVGTSIEDTKSAVLEVMREKIPLTVQNLCWDKKKAQKNGWKFVIKEKELHDNYE